MWRELAVEQLKAFERALIVDVRSPSEHMAERVPGSINIPLLSDEERAVVGIIYKEQGELVARRHALSLIAPKVSPIIEQILSLQKQHGQQIVIYCWRGGLRSEAVASLLSIAGINCFRLTGGYKAWRRQVLNSFRNDRYGFNAVVLHGLTGVGKTEILQELDRRGLQALDLEALANHRGSAFGGLGLGSQPTQKNFEAVLWQQLQNMKPGFVFMEAESRKIGRLNLPDLVYKNMIRNGQTILVTSSMEGRVERIAADYLRMNARTRLAEALALLPNLQERIGRSKVTAISELALKDDVYSVIRVLLTEYYDPLYSKAIERAGPFELEISGDDPAGAANQIAGWVERHKHSVSVSSTTRVQI
jgi:tRNA 2-selenouridine synthase